MLLPQAEFETEGENRKAAPPRRAYVVEGDAQVRRLLARILRGLGLEVAAFADATGALERMRASGEPDLVCADVAHGLVLAVKRRPSVGNLLVLVEDGDPGMFERVLAAGACCFVSKTDFRVNAFREVVLQLLRR